MGEVADWIKIKERQDEEEAGIRDGFTWINENVDCIES
jgi:hypothetical protein